MDKLITVIIPCYNIEKYIERCIQSVEEQTYKNIEIIAVDDGSKDNTVQILEKLQNKYSNLKVFKNDKNKGAAYARNLAIRKSKGEYIGFIDSDDYIVKDYYEKLMQKAQEEDADLVATDIEITYEKNAQPAILSKACIGEVNKFNLVKMILLLCFYGII